VLIPPGNPVQSLDDVGGGDTIAPAAMSGKPDFAKTEARRQNRPVAEFGQVT
jgi:hypothetical protein